MKKYSDRICLRSYSNVYYDKKTFDNCRFFVEQNHSQNCTVPKNTSSMIISSQSQISDISWLIYLWRLVQSNDLQYLDYFNPYDAKPKIQSDVHKSKSKFVNIICMTKSIITKDAGHVFLPASVEDHILLSFVRSEPTLGNKKFSLMKIFNIYSCDCKFVIFCFALLLPQILDNFHNQGLFWNLMVLTISQHPLLVKFDLVWADILEVKDI